MAKHRTKRKPSDYELRRARIWAIDFVKILFFMVLHEQEGFGKKRLQRVYHAVAELAESVGEKYCTVDDLRQVLKDEYGIEV